METPPVSRLQGLTYSCPHAIQETTPHSTLLAQFLPPSLRPSQNLSSRASTELDHLRSLPREKRKRIYLYIGTDPKFGIFFTFADLERNPFSKPYCVYPKEKPSPDFCHRRSRRQLKQRGNSPVVEAGEGKEGAENGAIRQRGVGGGGDRVRRREQQGSRVGRLQWGRGGAVAHGGTSSRR